MATANSEVGRLAQAFEGLVARVRAIEESDKTLNQQAASATLDLQKRIKSVEEQLRPHLDDAISIIHKDIEGLSRRVKSIEAGNCVDKPTPVDGAKRDWQFEHYLRKYVGGAYTDVAMEPAPAAPAERPARHATLVRYLLDKVQEEDWHGVSDAANDLRELEARCGRR